MDSTARRTVTRKNEVLFPEISKALEKGETWEITVKGTSMLPTIVGGRDLVVLKASHCYSKDDIVLFDYHRKSGTVTLLHRIIRIEGDNVVIRGDGVAESVERCRLSDIRGKVTTILRKGEKAIDPYSRGQIFRLRLWNALRPLRRYILFLYRHLPWMIKYFN